MSEIETITKFVWITKMSLMYSYVTELFEKDIVKENGLCKNEDMNCNKFWEESDVKVQYIQENSDKNIIFSL